MLSRRKWSPHSNLDNAGSPKTQKPTSIQFAQYMNMYQDFRQRNINAERRTEE